MPPRKEIDASADVPAFYGAELRYRREAAGLTLEQCSDGSFRGLSFLSQVERGERRMTMDLAKHVDGKLGTDGFFERRCEDVRKARMAGHAEYFADVAEMEEHADRIEEWAPMLIPGLLQTEEYARAVVRAGRPWLPPETVESQVAARIRRAEIWDQEAPRPAYWVILHESVIRRPLLEPGPMAAQLRHIVEIVQANQGVLQVLPETEVAYPLMMGEVRSMTFPDAPPLMYTEGVHSGQLIDYPPLVNEYRRSYDLLRATALSPRVSLAMIEAAAEDYENAVQQQE
ncbi:helix-turn-helix transcriptional regulator [Streptomyces sp. NBC_01525]|uniref:Helix-turn-helix transcriptional regulator n=1 Tax=Streptomyces benahoarensis TaxID=2595054 RepID=A0A553Z3U6_9ACTN|nr:helix-turn-helix transcriptional regulator [Streptomyces benahoarensis]TSB18790.1 helix-turn-helix transcriptional regulator [Streptomyces benahoarensis]TSB36084.1 helix-turn-helix transcriptional regulator [Streptomyces benahoarensis]